MQAMRRLLWPSAAGMEYMTAQFLPWRKPWYKDVQTWIILCKVREVRSQTNYLLDMYCHLLQNI